MTGHPGRGVARRRRRAFTLVEALLSVFLASLVLVGLFGAFRGTLRRFAQGEDTALGTREAQGLLERTLVVLVSDHGDEFYEHGGLGHGKTLYEEVIRGFAIFWTPAIHPTQVDRPIEGIDVPPTILRLAGVEPPTGVPGRAVLDVAGQVLALPARPRFSALGGTKSVTRGGWKLIRGPRGAEQVFERSEGVERPVASPPSDVVETLRQSLATRFGASPAHSRKATKPGTIDPSTQDALRALGYLDP